MGRYEELLVKERYAAFQEIAGTLFELENILEGLAFQPADDPYEGNLVPMLVAVDRKITVSHKNLLFNSSNVRKRVNLLSASLFLLIEHAKRIEKLRSSFAPAHAHQTAQSDFTDFAYRVQADTQDIINALFEEQNLPSVEMPFPKAQQLRLQLDERLIEKREREKRGEASALEQPHSEEIPVR